MSDQYSDGLRLDSRRRIVNAALRSIPAHRTGSAWSFIPKMAAAAALLAVLALPALRITPSDPRQEGSTVRDLQVTTSGGEVVLTWQDGNRPHRVIRATSRQELAHMGQIPGEVVRGERWVDSRSDGAAVVFYLVE